MEPHLHVEHWGESLWLVVAEGEHDLSTAPQFEVAFVEIHRHGSDVLVDFSAATFVDSTVISMFVRHAQTERVMVVAPPGTPPRHVFDLVGLASCLGVYDTRDHALRALGR